MLNEKIGITVTDLSERAAQPTVEELKQIFGGWGWRRNVRRFVRFHRRVISSARRGNRQEIAWLNYRAHQEIIKASFIPHQLAMAPLHRGW